MAFMLFCHDLSIILCLLSKHNPGASNAGCMPPQPIFTITYRVSDVGCGIGTTIKELKEKVSNAVIIGVEQNDKLRELAADNISEEIEIIKGDIRMKSDIPKDIDVVICQRVSINWGSS